MNGTNLFSKKPVIIAALHLPPFAASHHPAACSVSHAIEHALRNTERAVKGGIEVLYIQDLGDNPVAPSIQPHTVANLAAVGYALHREFPDLALGVCMMSHGAREPIAVAQAISAKFVRLKVYVGAMVKAEGIIQGCAYDAIQYRSQVGAEELSILADVYDRTGSPVGELPLIEEARQAAVFGRADGLVLTGRSFNESKEILETVKQEKLGVPLLLGGGAGPENIAEALKYADGVVVSSAFKAIGGWTRQSILTEWDTDRIKAFVTAVNKVVEK